MFALIDQSWYEESPAKMEKEILSGRYPGANTRKLSQTYGTQYYRADGQKHTLKTRHLQLVADSSLGGDSSDQIEQINQKTKIDRIETTVFSHKLTEIIAQNSQYSDQSIARSNKNIMQGVISAQGVSSGIKTQGRNIREISSCQSHVHRKRKSSKKRSLMPRYVAMFGMAALVLFSFYHVYHKHTNIAANSTLGHSLVISHNETVSQIAQAFAPDLPQSEVIDEIMRLNNLQSNYVSPGEVIIMPNV